MSLDRPDHTGYHLVSIKQATRFRFETPPGTGGKFAKQLAIKACMDSKAFGNSEDDWPMSDRKTDVFGNVHRGQQSPLLMT
tara:strand:- start:108 stop:350 length:243 start_codon:yes stop_codon:yes gene_type:complete